MKLPRALFVSLWLFYGTSALDAAEPESAPPAAFDIVGVWRHAGPLFKCDLEFARDGVFRGYVYPLNGPVWSFRGRWSVVGDRLYYTYTASSAAHTPEGTEDEDQILEANADSIHLLYRSGKIYRYDRIAKLEPPPNHGSMQ